MGLRGPKPRGNTPTWSSLTAYAVGLMASDGNLSKDGRHLVFVSKDRELIQSIKQAFGVTANERLGPIHGKDDGRVYYRLQWGSVAQYEFLTSVGLTARKSLTIAELRIPKQYFFDFLRGTFDGDGCFYSYYDKRWKSSFMFYLDFVSASEPHLDWLQREVSEQLGIQGHRTRSVSHTFFHLKYAKQESLTLLKKMYEDPKAPALKRKKLKITKALRIVSQSLPT